MKIHKITFRDSYYILLGFLGFSMLGQYVILNVLRLPFSFMELFYLPLLYKYKSRIWVCIKKVFIHPNKKLLILEFLLVAGILFGIVETLNFGIVINYRSIIYALLVIVYIKTYSVNIDLRVVYWINFAAILGDFVYVNFISASDISSSINCIAISLAVFSAFLGERYFMGCIAGLIGFLNGITSGFRLGIVISFLVLFEMFVFTIVRNDDKKTRNTIVKRIGVIVIAIALIAGIAVNYEQIILVVADKLGMSSFAIFRVTERMQRLLSLDFIGSQDTGRLIIYQYPLQRFFRCLIPRGLIGDSIGEYWLYIDVPILYLYDLFGSLGAVYIICKCFAAMISNVKVVFSNRINVEKTLAVLMMPVLFFLEIINGTFCIVVFQAIETAAVLGVLFSDKNT